MTPSISWSNFALKQNKKNPVFTCTPESLLAAVMANWEERTPGAGRKDLAEVVLVPIQDLSVFLPQWIPIGKAHSFETKLTYRQAHEDPYLETTALGEALPINKAFVVCYSRAALLSNNGEVSSDSDWEIVAVIASSIDNEPMQPLTMARNYLQKPGGTFAPYTPELLAESIYFWSGYVRARNQ